VRAQRNTPPSSRGAQHAVETAVDGDHAVASDAPLHPQYRLERAGLHMPFWLGRKRKERPVTTRTEELLAEGVITRLGVMVQEHQPQFLDSTSSCPRPIGWRICSSRFTMRSLGRRKETGFADQLTELHAISVSDAQVLHQLDERSLPNRTAGAIGRHPIIQ
jgi:hypothetical protein